MSEPKTVDTNETEIRRQLFQFLKVAKSKTTDNDLVLFPLLEDLYTYLKKHSVQERINELQSLTEWQIGDTGDENYDFLHARHKRSYDDRIKELKEQL